MEQIRAYLNSISPITSKTWESIQPLFTKAILAKSEFFEKEGNIATKIAFLEEGIVRTCYHYEGKEYNKAFDIAPMLISGYASLITGNPSQISLQALTNCIIWTANYRAICHLYDQYPDLERVGRKIAELSFVEKEQRELELATLDADKRYELFQQRTPDIELRIAQHHIASYLGISSTQLSRIRRDLATKK